MAQPEEHYVVDEEFGFYETGLTYRDDPDGFVQDCFAWERMRRGDRPTAYQLRCLRTLAEHHKEAVRGPHGLGKTAMAAWVIIWFSLTRAALAVDWKAPTTSGSWRQLRVFLWPEVHKWLRYMRWEIIGREALIPGAELLDLSIKLTGGQAFAVASDHPQTIEGAHADSMLYLFDESKAIQDGTFDAAEGAFSGAGPDTGREAYAIAFSTPGAPKGRFFDIHRKARGLEDWTPIHVTVGEAIKAGRISEEWAERRRLQWGESSSLYRNRVLGEFSSGDDDSVIKLEWIEAANERWLEWRERETARLKAGGEPRRLSALGVDVSYGGADKTVVSLRDENVVVDIRSIAVKRDKAPTVKTYGEVAHLQRTHGGVAIVDVIGYGAGVYDQLVRDQLPAEKFVAGAKAVWHDGSDPPKPIVDRTGDLGFVDMRAAAWWHFRELLNPDYGSDICLPPDDQISGLDERGSVLAELVAPRWDHVAGGRIRVESKDELRKPERLGRSTDYADAIIQAFAAEFFRRAPRKKRAMPIIISAGGSNWKPT